jgi:hypothetical protein
MSNKATFVRYRIVIVSILMAFGLYLTRVSLGEIVKSDSFLNDKRLIGHPATRFELELLDSGTASKPLLEFVCRLTERSEADAESMKLSYPQLLKLSVVRDAYGFPSSKSAQFSVLSFLRMHCCRCRPDGWAIASARVVRCQCIYSHGPH